jgi:DNA polymerase I-like protein with 3'-5' exonuclease and polymerase domains
MTTTLDVCSECGRSYIHAMTCSKYAGSPPMAPAAIDAAMAVDPEGYVTAQHQHNDEAFDLEKNQLAFPFGEEATDELSFPIPEEAEIAAIMAPDPLPTPAGGIMLVELNGTDTEIIHGVLWKAGINPENVTIASVMSVGKPSKKTMVPVASNVVMKILEARPAVIILFGSDLLKALTTEEKITSAHGRRATFNAGVAQYMTGGYDPFIIPIQSPSSIAHSPKGPQIEQQIIEDLKLAIAESTDSFVEIPVPWIWEGQSADVLWTHAKAMPELEKTVWAADIETNGLPTWHPDHRIFMIAVDCGYDPVAVFRGADVRNAIELLRRVLETGATVVGHNWSGFDRVSIQNRTGINLRGDDTMLLAHLLNEDRGKGLETWVTAELRVRPWKDELPENCWQRGGRGEFNDEEWNRVGLYCARDTRYDRLLFLKQMEMIAGDVDLFRYYKAFFLPFSRALATIEQRGLYIDQDKIMRAWGKYELQKMRGEVAARFLTGDPDFNPGSWQQVGKVLFDTLKLPAVQWTKEGEESTNEFSLKTLKYLVETDPIYNGSPQVPALVNAILDYRQAVKYEGTYLRVYARIALSSPIASRGFPSYSLVGSVSRTSSYGGEKDDPNNFGFNTQNRPRDLDIIGAAPGKVLVHADASQLELRTIAQCSMSQPMIDALNAGKDLHAELAMEIRRLRGDKHPEQFTPEDRSHAKPGNFGFGYGADEYTFEVIALKDYDMVIPRSESTLIRNAFHNRWQLRPWYERQMAEASSTGQVRSLSGRVRRLPNIHSSDPKIRLEALRQAINFPAQELGLTIWGCVLILAIGMGLPVVQEIHDSMDIECTPEEIPDVITKIKAIEAQIPAVLKNTFGFELVVPFIIDVSTH